MLCKGKSKQLSPCRMQHKWGQMRCTLGYCKRAHIAGQTNLLTHPPQQGQHSSCRTSWEGVVGRLSTRLLNSCCFCCWDNCQCLGSWQASQTHCLSLSRSWFNCLPPGRSSSNFQSFSSHTFMSSLGKLSSLMKPNLFARMSASRCLYSACTRRGPYMWGNNSTTLLSASGATSRDTPAAAVVINRFSCLS